jgi:ribosomal protein S18 acetylase RimI-like enzyme
VTLTLRTMSEAGLDLAAATLDRGFSDYVVKIPFTTSLLLQMIRQDSVDPALSMMVMDGDAAVGAGLVARRGWTSRLAAMSIVPEARRHGAGAFLVRELLQASRARGERAMVLEVIESNEPAVRLYRTLGFEVVHRLVGLKREPAPVTATPSNADLETADIRDVARLVSLHAPDLPWQVSGESLAQSGPPARAFERDGAFAIVTDPTAAAIVIRAVVTLPEVRGQGRARALIAALARAFPDRPLTVSPICPEPFAALFEGSGFARTPLSQLMMRVDHQSMAPSE